MKIESIKDIATHHLVVANWRAGLEDAFRGMNDSRVRHLPVVDDAGAIVGIISDRDFSRALQDVGPRFSPEAEVRDLMSWPVRVVDESETVVEAARLMLSQKISALLVVRENEVTGIVTTDDLLRALVEPGESSIQELTKEAQAAIYRTRVGDIAQVLADIGI